ncbi:hypothetical protein EYF80_034356 [Liparis tanakae]|uniref:Uncharacterized protein n=1 Tax=Liparis tanakae TaxID=230148 RepID=A0A4Z2GPK6_9TELE|nr:hypothetical protein EYF80_034356 [Liparis tanakae]
MRSGSRQVNAFPGCVALRRRWEHGAVAPPPPADQGPAAADHISSDTLGLHYNLLSLKWTREFYEDLNNAQGGKLAVLTWRFKAAGPGSHDSGLKDETTVVLDL